MIVSGEQLRDSSINISVSILLEAQMVKNLPAMQETPVRSLGQEDPLEKGMATYSSRHSLRSKFSCIGSSWVCKGCLVLRPLK